MLNRQVKWRKISLKVVDISVPVFLLRQRLANIKLVGAPVLVLHLASPNLQADR